MIAFCEFTLDPDTVSLLANRITILGVCAWGISFCGRRAIGTLDSSLVPRWFWLVPTTILSTLAGLVGWFTVSCTSELSVWQRTLYGALLVWAIAALLSVIVTGHARLREAKRKADEYQSRLEQALRELSGGSDE